MNGFAGIAASLAADIRRGALRAGDRLPSSRAMAARLGVNRNTVVAAYDELVAQGWVIARGPAGTFVAAETPDREVRRRAPAPRGLPARPGYAMRGVSDPPTSPFAPVDAKYHLSLGVPDTRLLPTAILARAYRRALRARGAAAGRP
jgi:GntR family transcriptional regulator/MocR family aminotransferase